MGGMSKSIIYSSSVWVTCERDAEEELAESRKDYPEDTGVQYGLYSVEVYSRVCEDYGEEGGCLGHLVWYRKSDSEETEDGDYLGSVHKDLFTDMKNGEVKKITLTIEE